MFPLRTIENVLLDYKIRRMVKKSSKSVKNKCSHCAIPPALIGNMAIAKEILDMFEFSRNKKKPFPLITISINALCRNKEVLLLCDGLRLFLSVAVSIAVSHSHRSVGTLLYTD